LPATRTVAALLAAVTTFRAAPADADETPFADAMMAAHATMAGTEAATLINGLGHWLHPLLGSPGAGGLAQPPGLPGPEYPKDGINHS
jgi:hypothetical protein